jgi:OOP family OmpA-OmpF porin
MAYFPSNTQILKYSLGFILALLIIPDLTGQRMPPLSSTNKKALKAYEEGSMAMRSRAFDVAIVQFQKALKYDSGFAEAYLSIANCYVVLGDKPAAKPWLEKAIRFGQGRSDFHMAYQALGDLCYERGEYNCAQQQYLTYLGLRSARKDLIPELKERIRNCEFALQQQKSPHRISPKKTPDSVNAFQYQYFPTLPADQQQIFFTARNDNSLEDIMVSNKMGELWSLPRSVSPLINDVSTNDGTCAISGDGRSLVLTACERKGNVGRCDLYMSYFQAGVWTKPENMGIPVNSVHWESQPSLSSDGRILIFTSDKPGGYGKRDLYISRKGEDGKWSSPKNMGLMINTAKDELSPFIHANNQSLFFASNGHLGMGGFDMYMVNLADSIKDLPINLGYPINTHQDEVSLFLTADGKRAYYSLDLMKPGMHTGGRSFIYELEWPESLTVPRSIVWKGHVYDAESKKPLAASLEMAVLSRSAENLRFRSDSSDGSYTVVLTEQNKYGLFVEAPGYLYESINIDFINSEQFDRQTLDLYLQPLKKGSSVVMNNLFFDTDKYELKPESTAELQTVFQLLKRNQALAIEIGGHTDDVGKDDYNLELSRKRAQSVHQYLLDNGVPPKRISYAGYGEKKPKLANTSDESRAVNRRIEFVIR